MIATLLTITSAAMTVIEVAARTCHATTDKAGIGTDTLVRSCINLGHLGILEHASATFLIHNVSRTLTHQLVRHRHLSFCQESQRHVKQSPMISVIPQSVINKPDLYRQYLEMLYNIEMFYDHLRKSGVPKEDARFILPEGTKTSITVTGNFRAWLEFLKQRLDKPAQWEIKELAAKLYGILHTQCPVIFNEDTIGNNPKRNYEIIGEIK